MCEPDIGLDSSFDVLYRQLVNPDSHWCYPHERPIAFGLGGIASMLCRMVGFARITPDASTVFESLFRGHADVEGRTHHPFAIHGVEFIDV